MSKIVVLGCGPVGWHMAVDLCKGPGCEVVSVDVNRKVLERLAHEHPGHLREDLALSGARRPDAHRSISELTSVGYIIEGAA